MQNTNNLSSQNDASSKNEGGQTKKKRRFWKILSIILIIIIILLLLTQCQCLKKSYFPSEEDLKCPAEQTTSQNYADTENNIISDNKDISTNNAKDECSYLGKWTRTGTYVDGDLENTVPATLELKEDSYYSVTDACFAQGDLIITGNKSMTMKLDNTDCPGNLPTSYDYTYELKCDGTDPVHLDITTIESGVTIKETYDRAQ